MPIFRKDRSPLVLYVHVPKTGGTYIEDLFKANEFERTFWETKPGLKGLRCSPQHFHAEIFTVLLDLAVFDCKFLTVRNPVDRLASEFRMQTAKSPSALKPWLEKIERSIANNPFSHDNHLRTQVEFAHPGIDVWRQEDRFDAKWAKKMNDRYGLGLTVLKSKRRRNSSETARALDASDCALLSDFCTRYYNDDFRAFGYRPEAAKVISKSQS